MLFFFVILAVLCVSPKHCDLEVNSLLFFFLTIIERSQLLTFAHVLRRRVIPHVLCRRRAGLADGVYRSFDRSRPSLPPPPFFPTISFSVVSTMLPDNFPLYNWYEDLLPLSLPCAFFASIVRRPPLLFLNFVVMIYLTFSSSRTSFSSERPLQPVSFSGILKTTSYPPRALLLLRGDPFSRACAYMEIWSLPRSRSIEATCSRSGP